MKLGGGVEGGEGVDEVDAEELGDGLVGDRAGDRVDAERHRRVATRRRPPGRARRPRGGRGAWRWSARTCSCAARRRACCRRRSGSRRAVRTPGRRGSSRGSSRCSRPGRRRRRRSPPRGFIACTIASSTTTGARPPATSTAPISRSASATLRSIAPRFDASVMIRPRWIWSTQRNRSRFLSTRTTSASIPAAIHAAFQPTLPAPRTTTFAGRTPGAPPISTPRPPLWRSRKWAPICGASRPATSLIGASSGSAPLASCTVS